MIWLHLVVILNLNQSEGLTKQISDMHKAAFMFQYNAL
jgi:hypothetical protein